MSTDILSTDGFLLTQWEMFHNMVIIEAGDWVGNRVYYSRGWCPLYLSRSFWFCGHLTPWKDFYGDFAFL